MQTIELTVFADYHQFYLQDDDARFGDLSDAWTPDATERLMAVAEHVVGIGTVRNVEVPVRIEVGARLPSLDPSQWDRVNRALLVYRPDRRGRLYRLFPGCQTRERESRNI